MILFRKKHLRPPSVENRIISDGLPLPISLKASIRVTYSLPQRKFLNVNDDVDDDKRKRLSCVRSCFLK